MWHTFSYDSTHSRILISAKAWSDFGWMFPLARSFSFGNNWPPQNPLFAGEPLKYHFLLYLTVGMLEKVGVQIDWAFNLISGFGFFILLFMIFFVARKLFNSNKVAILSLAFFLFNGSLSFLEYFQEHGWSWETIKNIIHNSQYPSFGPWDGSQIAAIWNLNIYTNQRSFGFSLGLVLLLIYFLYVKQRINAVTVGSIIATLLFLNQGLLPALAILISWHFLVFPHLRKDVIKMLFFTIPFVLYSFRFVNPFSAEFHPGFLINTPLTFTNVAKYWFANLGLHTFLIPIGILMAPPLAKQLAVPLLAIFLLPNLVQFSPDMFNNHKLLNVFIVLGGMYSAWTIFRLWKIRPLKIVIPILIFLVTFSGIIDLFALANDSIIPVPDIKSNPDARFFYQNTPPNSTVLNSTWFYHPASLAGRLLFNGYPYFTWAHGYDQVTREQLTQSIYSAPTAKIACRLLRAHDISYVELNRRPESFLRPNWYLWQQVFVPEYSNPDSGINVYNVFHICPGT